MSDINKMSNLVMVKQEVIEDETETFILPDSAEIKQELHVELPDCQGIKKETDDQLQQSCSRNSTHRKARKEMELCSVCRKIFRRSRGGFRPISKEMRKLIQKYYEVHPSNVNIHEGCRYNVNKLDKLSK